MCQLIVNIFLVDAVFHHSKLQLDTERRVQTLANEMWLQQADICRNQEKALQDNLNAIIKQNRELQRENENLMRKNEKLSVKIGSVSSYINPRAVFGNVQKQIMQ